MIIRKASENDIRPLYNLYKLVAKNDRGIARMEEEITQSHFESIFHGIQNGGNMLVGEDERTESLIAEIHATKYGIKIFDHILTNLTIVVHPEYQGSGLGKKIFKSFLDEISNERKDIRRIELESRSSNQRSLRLYKDLGFVQEGIMKDKTRNRDGSFEDSILMSWENPAFIEINCGQPSKQVIGHTLEIQASQQFINYTPTGN